MRQDDAADVRGVYATVWRWHFYAGLFVAPFMIVLALTGLAMLAGDALDRWQFGPVTVGTTNAGPVTHQTRLDAARVAIPGAVILRYEPFDMPGEATRVSATVDGQPHTIYVDAGTGRLCGVVDDGHRLGLTAEKIHGTLLMGDVGDRLIEIAAGLGVVLLLSGLYLWFPRVGRGSAKVLGRWHGRLAWRKAHALTGLLLAPALLFYLISGLAWTGVWGGRYVQTWNTFPAEKFAPAPASRTQPTHEALNGAGLKVVPWNLEQAALPRSSGESGAPIAIDEAIAAAQRAGIGARFWVGVPDGPDGVWTVAQTAFDGNIRDPREELTIHIDQYTGAVRGRVPFTDYSWGAKAMATGIPLHKGHLGTWNLAGAIAVCGAIILLAVSGLVTWWLRRPTGSWRLAAPPRSTTVQIPRVVWVTVVLVAVAFPLLAVTFAAVAVLDRVVVRRLPRLARLLN